MENERQRYTISASNGQPYPNDRSENPWYVGHLIYFNRADPRAIVPKYSGLGVTFNFARPATLWVTLGPLLLMAAVVLMMILVFTANRVPAAVFLSTILPLLFLILFLILFLVHLNRLLKSHTF